MYIYIYTHHIKYFKRIYWKPLGSQVEVQTKVFNFLSFLFFWGDRGAAPHDMWNFLYQGSNLCSLQWKHWVWTTGSPRKFSRLYFCFVDGFLCCAQALSLIRSHLFTFIFIFFILGDESQRTNAMIYVKKCSAYVFLLKFYGMPSYI